ncbi:DUF4229 domain-containing protein [Candidatus Woesearchaeota archaeon]|nr:DUF4229 domain-containing protein [Candidatus Woesearchaeota archaeon]
MEKNRIIMVGMILLLALPILAIKPTVVESMHEGIRIEVEQFTYKDIRGTICYNITSIDAKSMTSYIEGTKNKFKLKDVKIKEKDKDDNIKEKKERYNKDKQFSYKKDENKQFCIEYEIPFGYYDKFDIITSEGVILDPEFDSGISYNETTINSSEFESTYWSTAPFNAVNFTYDPDCNMNQFTISRNYSIYDAVKHSYPLNTDAEDKIGSNDLTISGSPPLEQTPSGEWGYYTNTSVDHLRTNDGINISMPETWIFVGQYNYHPIGHYKHFLFQNGESSHNFYSVVPTTNGFFEFGYWNGSQIVSHNQFGNTPSDRFFGQYYLMIYLNSVTNEVHIFHNGTLLGSKYDWFYPVHELNSNLRLNKDWNDAYVINSTVTSFAWGNELPEGMNASQFAEYLYNDGDPIEFQSTEADAYGPFNNEHGNYTHVFDNYDDYMTIITPSQTCEWVYMEIWNSTGTAEQSEEDYRSEFTLVRLALFVAFIAFVFVSIGSLSPETIVALCLGALLVGMLLVYFV